MNNNPVSQRKSNTRARKSPCTQSAFPRGSRMTCSFIHNAELFIALNITLFHSLCFSCQLKTPHLARVVCMETFSHVGAKGQDAHQGIAELGLSSSFPVADPAPLCPTAACSFPCWMLVLPAKSAIYHFS